MCGAYVLLIRSRAISFPYQIVLDHSSLVRCWHAVLIRNTHNDICGPNLEQKQVTSHTDLFVCNENTEWPHPVMKMTPRKFSSQITPQEKRGDRIFESCHRKVYMILLSGRPIHESALRWQLGTLTTYLMFSMMICLRTALLCSWPTSWSSGRTHSMLCTR